MGKYLSPQIVEGDLKSIGFSTIALAATTIVTTPNYADNDGALYDANVYLQVRTIDGGTTPTIQIAIIATQNGSARTMIVPIQTEAGGTAATFSVGALGVGSGSIAFRADKNTAIQYSQAAGGTPSNNGVIDLMINIQRIR